MLMTAFDKAGVPTPPLGGTDVAASGSDPNIDTMGVSGLRGCAFDQAIVSTFSGEATANASGLPASPCRVNLAEGTVALPTLQDRRPGTIDQR